MVEWGAQSKRVRQRHVQIFIPSVNRDGNPVPRGQAYWVHECLEVMGTLFGGATAFPPSRGVWRDDEREGTLVFEDTVLVFSYAGDEELTGPAGTALLEFVMRLGQEAEQGEVGLYVDGSYYGFQEFDDEGLQK